MPSIRTLLRPGVVAPALLVALALLGATATVPATARANATQFSIMMDDDLLLYRSHNARVGALGRMKGLGVDYVRVTVLWSVVAENARSTPRRRKRFRAARPSTYPHANWDRYDDLVREARRQGIGVYFNLTGPGPDFAHQVPPRSHRRNRRTWKPKIREFYKFVAAVGTRYSGAYRDENGARDVLPRVFFWSLWNEPNQGGWLTPQWEFSRAARRMVPASPAIYRKLYFYGRRALERTGHGNDIILVGETAPLGTRKQGSRTPIRPKKFLREMFCVDGGGNALRGRSAAIRGCSDFRRFRAVRATAWAHHPYTKNLAPTVRDASPDSVTMANIGDLPALLDQIAARTGRVGGGLGVVSAEFGYETNPPDPFSGISLDRQAQYLNEGDYLAYLNPRVLGQTQFLLRDVAPRTQHRRNSKAYWFTYQSGLYTIEDRPKPALLAYTFPFFAAPAGTNPQTGAARVGFWGQLRFRPNDQTDYIRLEFLPSGGSEWRVVGEVVPVPPGRCIAVATAQGCGFFRGLVDSPGPGSWRARWVRPEGPTAAVTRVVTVG
jgi:hypothetical protein